MTVSFQPSQNSNLAIEPNATALIVTLQMDPAASARFTAMRREHFPAHRNWLDAHITLFHALPIGSMDLVLRDAAELASSTDAFRLRVDRVLFLGAGVAYALSSVQAVKLRSALVARWSPLLSPQDRNKRGALHITVQNKVSPSAARQLHGELEQAFEPHEIDAVGLQVWHYVGGPWRHAATFPFTDRVRTQVPLAADAAGGTRGISGPSSS
ncbi:2'-5' RNA ligase family protein [Xylophilus sp. Leaf220]|uniref:2'-5' RNA ligase family protein n=1 Tax=Xylophilus sp. Leaf220 TaxID=1735686 RepID=UPI0009E9F5F1|nr:2'-5' RNA ligase family protein [Xylophilus sp. Leaf220]